MDRLINFWAEIFGRSIELINGFYVVPGVSVLAIIIGFIALAIIVSFVFRR